MMSVFTRAAVAALAVICAWATQAKADEPDSAHSMMDEDSPEVFLAKATLQQYLSRVVRKDWEGTRRLTHPKALGVLEKMKRRGAERHGLAPWGDADTRLETFRFMAAREVSPGVILVSTGEDNFHVGEQNVSADDPAVYVLLRYRGSYLIADKKVGVQLADVSPDSIRQAYPGWAESPRMAEARRGPNRLRRR
jgi:hypothetical protein